MSMTHKGARYYCPDFGDSGELPDGSLLFLSDARGIYIPRDFAESVDFANTDGIRPDDWAEILYGPEAPNYWEAWNSITDSGTVRDPKTGTVYGIWQDGDCWLIPLEAI